MANTGTEMDAAEIEGLVRLACGLGPRAATMAASNGQQTDDLSPSRFVRLAVDLMLITRQAGLSPTESGGLFLLLATHLLNEIPQDGIADMIEHLRSQPKAALDRPAR